MAVCPRCDATTRTTQFGPSQVTWCTECHAIRSRPLVDARVPRYTDHVKALHEEIAIEEEDAKDPDKVLICMVMDVKKGDDHVAMTLQVTEGDARWVVAGSRVEGHPAEQKPKADNTSSVKVVSRSGSILRVEAERMEWAQMSQGTSLLLAPSTSATLYRNLLRAFLLTRKMDPYAADLEQPLNLPPKKSVPVPVDGLRPGQADALRCAAGLPDRGLLMIHGPPGTGKTTVIARFIAHAVRAGLTVLVTSHTHVAIDNALRKAIKNERGLRRKIVRLGEAGKVSPDMGAYQRKIGSFHMDPEEEGALPLFANITQDFPVVGMTLDALACALVFANDMDQELDRFDVVIVDEAGMNSYPKLAVAHAAGKRLALVGDPQQLPPIVRAWSFRDDVNYKRSHFELLQMLRPDLTVLLDEQFRCHPAIYSWSDDAVYDGQVTSQKEARLSIPLLWTEPLDSPVVWVDTSTAPSPASRAGTSRINPGHLDLAMSIIEDLLVQGVAPEDIGYISPFKAQAVAMTAKLEGHKRAHATSRVTASTVDAFQGNERRVMLYDLTTNSPAKPHDDHRRLNVSLTRPQDLLIILGRRDFVRTPSANPYYASLQRWSAVQFILPPGGQTRR